MTYSSTGVAYGSSYVIAETSDEAYKKVRKFLDENDLGLPNIGNSIKLN